MPRDTLVLGKTYETMNYDKFSFVASNRGISDHHVEEIMSEIKRNDLRHENPVKVNENHEILEGQHTYIASKNLGLSIVYKYTDMTVSDIGLFNSVQKSWSYPDILNHYCVEGYQDYLILHEFTKKFPYPIATMVILLTAQNTKQILKDFKKGEFKITQSLKQVEDILIKLREFKEFDDRVFRHKTFVLTYFDLLTHPDFDHEILVHKCSIVPDRFVRKGTQKEYLRMIEDIYNYRNRNPIRLY
jgi:hypothetical protein